jgi:hypothetical protein
LSKNIECGGEGVDDKQSTINIPCSNKLKESAKMAILEKGIKSFQDGYLKIFEAGLEKFKKEEKQKQ